MAHSISEHAALLLRQPLLVHVGAVMFLLWLASFFQVSSLWIFVIAFLFLYEADRNYIKNVRRQIRSEEKRSAHQARPLSDFETVQWLNESIERIWPQFLEKFVSQEFLTPMVPWFLDKYKPWTVKKASLQHLYLGRRPPIFTGIRILERTSDDDDLVMDLCLDFLAADDMDATISVQMARRVGLGMRTNIHISKLQIEGKIRVGVKFSNSLPFLSRIRICFEAAPYVQMTARPLFTHGVNVSELPLIAGWMERLVADVFEECLVEPNMLVLDVEKLVSSMSGVTTPQSSRREDWFEIQEKPPIAVAHLEILEALDLKPSDLNGLADPYVKGSFSTYRFKTKIEKKTCSPKWHEDFEVPIISWKLQTQLVLHVYDKDTLRDDYLGCCEVNLAEYRDGQHHDIWIPLKEVKMGRLHIALKITESVTDASSSSCHVSDSKENVAPNQEPHDQEKPDVSEKLEVINLGNGNVGFVSIVSPGQITSVTSWQQRHGMKKNDSNVSEIEGKQADDMDASEGSEESPEDKTTNKSRKHRLWSRRERAPVSSMTFKESANVPTVEVVSRGNKGTTVSMKVEEPADSCHLQQQDVQSSNLTTPTISQTPSSVGKNSPDSPSKRAQVKHMGKGFMHNVGAVFNRKVSSGRSSTAAEGEEKSL